MDTNSSVNRASLSEQAYMVIKTMINRLELKPGQLITEAQLSQKLNISKSPIRSALIHLQRDGLVDITPYKETIVSPVSVEQVKSIYETRALIEPFVVTATTPGMTQDHLDALDEILTTSASALKAEDFVTFFRVSTKFHEFFIRRHDNYFFSNMFQVIDAQMERLRLISATIGNHPEKQLEEHRSILDAVASGDGERSGDVMRRHILGYLDDILEEIEAQALGDPAQKASLPQ